MFLETTDWKKPKKKQLGLAMKSLTSSRQNIKPMNRLGIHINLYAVTEIKVDMTFEAINRCQYINYMTWI